MILTKNFLDKLEKAYADGKKYLVCTKAGRYGNVAVQMAYIDMVLKKAPGEKIFPGRRGFWIHAEDREWLKEAIYVGQVYNRY